MSTRDQTQDMPALWRSLDEQSELGSDRHATPEFSGPASPDSIDRRRLLEIMAASLALAGLAGCNSGTQFGAPLWSAALPTGHGGADQIATIATSLELEGIGRGVLVETAGGRPVKIEGNPQHPGSLGATDVFMQAEILNLYDPARSQHPSEHGQRRTWEQAFAMLAALRGRMQRDAGEGLHILTGPVGSPTMTRLLGEVARAFPEARLHRYSPLHADGEYAGAMHAFGEPVRVLYDFASADAVVSLGTGFLDAGPDQVRHGAAFEQRRARGRHDSRMPILVAAETTPGLTGARADERIVLRPDEIAILTRGVAQEMGVGQQRVALPERLSAAAVRIAAVLKSASPNGILFAGRDQSPSVHAAAHAINVSLGAVGRSVQLVAPAGIDATSLSRLAAAMAAGDVRTLLILGCNPVYDAPADVRFAELLARVEQAVHLGVTANETAWACRWHLPMLHALESWGDTRASDGTVGLQQPTTRPLVPGITAIELLAALDGGSGDARRLVESTWRAKLGASFNERWLTALERGVVEGTSFASVAVTLQPTWEQDAEPGNSDAITVHFAADPCVWDGSFAGNAWLQELPKPISKLVWGNAALLAPATAAALKIRDGQVIEIAAGERLVAVPVMVQPGQARDVVTLALGYGREHAGAVGSHIGVSAYRLRTSAEPWAISGARVRITARRKDLITTQHHHAMEGRDIVRVVTADNLDRAPAAEPPQPSLYPEYAYHGNAWGMTIDLDACIGCNACVIACQAENNVPVVGPDEVARGREMHWLRIDRYYAGPVDTPATYFQPVPCMQCEKAPCEVVCPVNATVHSSEGLNDMVYNRCVGTRTCSNNCPYKVRRFNWFNYASQEPGSNGAQLNPDVTVRPRGVMEKCTYCTQRISAARIAAGMEQRGIRDGEIMTACQQACPTSAIKFGDVNAADSAVAREKASARNYVLLGGLNTQPRTSYLARVAHAAPGKDES